MGEREARRGPFSHVPFSLVGWEAGAPIPAFLLGEKEVAAPKGSTAGAVLNPNPKPWLLSPCPATTPARTAAGFEGAVQHGAGSPSVAAPASPCLPQCCSAHPQCSLTLCQAFPPLSKRSWTPSPALISSPEHGTEPGLRSGSALPSPTTCNSSMPQFTHLKGGNSSTQLKSVLVQRHSGMQPCALLPLTSPATKKSNGASSSLALYLAMIFSAMG